MWPLNFNLLKQTISEEFVLYLLGTISLFTTVYFFKVRYISNVAASLSPITDSKEGSSSYLNP